MGDAPTAAGNEAVPHRLGRYELVVPLASEGSDQGVVELAAVFLARVQGTEQPYVALELIRSDDPELTTTLVDEAKQIARARHQNLVELLDVDHCELGVFLVMEYVPGERLSSLQDLARAAGGELPRAVVLRILTDALLGLHALHEHTDTEGHALALIHRDFSARNILVGTDGIARVSGFGVAKALDANAAAAVDRRWDLANAGAIAWESLAGRKLTLSSTESPPRVTAVAADVPEDLAGVVERALRVDPNQRPANADVLGRDLVSAAKAAGLVATTDEIAAHVNRLVHGKLAERKTRLAEARREQQIRPLSMPDVRTMIGMGGLPAQKRLPLPDLPNRPLVHDDGASELRIAVTLEGARPAERADADILGEGTKGPDSEPVPEIIHSPVVVPVGEGEAARLSTRAVQGALGPLQLAVLGLFGPPWTTKKISTLAAIGGVVLGFCVVLAAFTGAGRNAQNATDAGATSASTGPGSSMAMSEKAPPAGGAGLPGTVGADSNTDRPSLRLTANAPIKSVSVGGRVVDAVIHAPTLGVDLTEEECDSALRVVVTSTDGRTATLTTTAGELDVEVIFAKPTPRPPAHPAGPAPTVKRPWTKHPR